jgi:hypothetical protein
VKKVIIKLSKPLNEKTEIGLDLDKLTGQHLIDATVEAHALGDKSPVLELSKTYQAVIAAKAAGVNVDDIIKLPAKDFVKITVEVASFLLE